MSKKVFLISVRSRLGMAGVLYAALVAGAYAHDKPKAMEAHAAHQVAGNALVGEQPFLVGNDAAMQKMMTDMAIKPTGDVDKDFVNMMIPHHQGAIDMAVLQLRYGTSVRLKAIAQEIVVTQQQEIAAMRLAVGEPIWPAPASPVSSSETHDQSSP